MDCKDEPWLKLLTAQERSSSYVSGYVVGREALDNLLRTFYDSTHSSFGVRQSVGESSKNQSLLLSGLVRRQVLWQQSLGDIKIPFDGTPFLVCGRSVVMECQHGARRQPSTCSSSSRKVFQASRKGTCEAVVKYQRVLRFPEHSISTGPTTSAYQLKSMKARAVTNVLLSFAHQTAQLPQVLGLWSATTCSSLQWTLMMGICLLPWARRQLDAANASIQNWLDEFTILCPLAFEMPEKFGNC